MPISIEMRFACVVEYDVQKKGLKKGGGKSCLIKCQTKKNPTLCNQ